MIKNLPQNWQMKRLGEVATLQGGFAFKSKEYSASGIPLIRIANISIVSPYLNISDLKYIKKTSLVDYKNYALSENDVLIAMTGATIGKIGIVRKKDTPCFLNQRVGRFIVNDKVSNSFLFYFLQTRIVQDKIKALGSGGAQANISPTQIDSIKIPLPPLKSQKAIVERMDAIRKAQELVSKQINLTDELFQSLLDQELNPKGKDWEIKKLKGIVLIHYGKGLAKSERKDDGIHWAYGSNGPVYKSNKFLVGYPTIIIGRKGAAGALQLIQESCWPIDTTFYVEIKNKNELSLEFLYYSLLMKNLESLIIVTAIPGINRDHLYRTKIPLPSISIQQKIVQKLQSVQDYKKKLSDQKAKLQELFDSALNRAMKGELVKERVVVSVKEAVINWFALKQAIGAVIESLGKKSYERGEMVIAKFMYLLQEVKGIPFNLNFVRHQFGPYDPSIKKAILASSFNKDKFFKVKGSGDKQVYGLGDNSNKLFFYNSRILNQTRLTLNSLMPDLAKEKSEDIERLTSVCKVIQDTKSTDIEVILKEMSEWKPTKFTKEQIEKALSFIIAKDWHLGLLK